MDMEQLYAQLDKLGLHEVPQLVWLQIITIMSWVAVATYFWWLYRHRGGNKMSKKVFHRHTRKELSAHVMAFFVRKVKFRQMTEDEARAWLVRLGNDSYDLHDLKPHKPKKYKRVLPDTFTPEQRAIKMVTLKNRLVALREARALNGGQQPVHLPGNEPVEAPRPRNKLQLIRRKHQLAANGVH